METLLQRFMTIQKCRKSGNDNGDPVLARILVEPEMTLELEARLGYLDNEGHFVSAIPREMFDSIQKGLDASKCWLEVSSDVLLDTTWLDEDGTEVRTRSVVQETDCPQTIQKVKLGRFDYPVQGSQRNLMMRIALAAEFKVEPKTTAVQPLWVRIKDIRSYRWKSPSRPGAWSYELSKTYSGHNRNEAARQQNENCAEYQFEIECPPIDSFTEPITLLESLIKKLHQLVQVF